MSIFRPCESEYSNLSACQVLKHYIDRKRMASNVSKRIGNPTREISFPIIIVFTPSFGDNLDYGKLSDTTHSSKNYHESNDNSMSFEAYKNSKDKKEGFVDKLLQINRPRFSRMFRDKNLENRYRIDTNTRIGDKSFTEKI